MNKCRQVVTRFVRREGGRPSVAILVGLSALLIGLEECASMHATRPMAPIESVGAKVAVASNELPRIFGVRDLTAVLEGPDERLLSNEWRRRGRSSVGSSGTATYMRGNARRAKANKRKGGSGKGKGALKGVKGKTEPALKDNVFAGPKGQTRKDDSSQLTKPTILKGKSQQKAQQPTTSPKGKEKAPPDEKPEETKAEEAQRGTEPKVVQTEDTTHPADNFELHDGGESGGTESTTKAVMKPEPSKGTHVSDRYEDEEGVGETDPVNLAAPIIITSTTEYVTTPLDITYRPTIPPRPQQDTTAPTELAGSYATSVTTTETTVGAMTSAAGGEPDAKTTLGTVVTTMTTHEHDPEETTEQITTAETTVAAIASTSIDKPDTTASSFVGATTTTEYDRWETTTEATWSTTSVVSDVYEGTQTTTSFPLTSTTSIPSGMTTEAEHNELATTNVTMLSPTSTTAYAEPGSAGTTLARPDDAPLDESDDHRHQMSPDVLPESEIFGDLEEGSDGNGHGVVASFSVAVRKTGATSASSVLTQRMNADGADKRVVGESMRLRLVETALRAMADVLDEKLGYDAVFEDPGALTQGGLGGAHNRRSLVLLKEITEDRPIMKSKLALHDRKHVPPKVRRMVTLHHDPPDNGLLSAATLVGEQEAITGGTSESPSLAWVAFRLVYKIVGAVVPQSNNSVDAPYHQQYDPREDWGFGHVSPVLHSSKEIEIAVKGAIYDSIGDGALLYHLRTYETRIVAVSEVGKEMIVGLGMGGPFVPKTNSSAVPARDNERMDTSENPPRPPPFHEIRIVGMVVLASTLLCWIILVRTSLIRRRRRELLGWRVGIRNEEDLRYLLRLSMARGGNNDMSHWDSSSIQDLINTGTGSGGGWDDDFAFGGRPMLIYGGPLGKSESSGSRGKTNSLEFWQRHSSLPTFSSDGKAIPITSAVYS